MKKKLLFLVLGLPAVLPAQGQRIGPSDIVAAGGSRTINTMTHEYAIGQVAVGATFISSSLVVTPGVLQPVFSTSGVAPDMLTAAEISVYPNPVTTTLFMQPAFNRSGVLIHSLYDATGKLVMQQEATSKTGNERQSISMAALAAGPYSLHIIWLQGDGKTSTTAYKIQKLQ